MNARQRRADRRKNESHLSKELRQMERAGLVKGTRVRIPKDLTEFRAMLEAAANEYVQKVEGI